MVKWPLANKLVCLLFMSITDITIVLRIANIYFQSEITSRQYTLNGNLQWQTLARKSLVMDHSCCNKWQIQQFHTISRLHPVQSLFVLTCYFIAIRLEGQDYDTIMRDWPLNMSRCLLSHLPLLNARPTGGLQKCWICLKTEWSTRIALRHQLKLLPIYDIGYFITMNFWPLPEETDSGWMPLRFPWGRVWQCLNVSS